VVVVSGEVGEVLGIDAVADHGRLVTHDIDAIEQASKTCAVTNVEAVCAGRSRCAASVCLLDHRVDADDLVPAPAQLRGDLGADEPGGAG
jgi:hypothetical protein